MNKLHLSNHVADQVKKYETGRSIRLAGYQLAYRKASRLKGKATLDAVLQMFHSIATLRVTKLIESIQDLRDAREAPLPLRAAALLPGNRESKNLAGLDGERRVLRKLGELCRKPCTAIMGYNGPSGEIDIVVVGRYGITAIEVKNTSGVHCCEGDKWWRVKNGESVWMQGARSPSTEVNECADQLYQLLAQNGIRVPVSRLVVMANPKCSFRSPFKPNVTVRTVADLDRQILNNLGIEEALDRTTIAKIIELMVKSHRPDKQDDSPLFEETYPYEEDRSLMEPIVRAIRRRTADHPILVTILISYCVSSLIALYVHLHNREQVTPTPAPVVQTLHTTPEPVKKHSGQSPSRAHIKVLSPSVR